MDVQKLTPELLLTAYSRGLFPMADSADAQDIYWYDPELRGQLPIQHLHVPRRLRKTIRHRPYRIGFNYDFSGVMDGCAESGPGREQTWINSTIREGFETLHKAGYAHSVEAWQDGHLVGGLYGLAIGGAFFGESMFSRERDASKICLVHLAAHLTRQGFTILDTQFVNEHLTQFGVYELPRDIYLGRLFEAVKQEIQFVPDSVLSVSGAGSDTVSSVSEASAVSSSDTTVSFPSEFSGVEAFLQSITQTS